MAKYTVIYTESWMSGSHMQTVVHMKRIECADNDVVGAAERAGVDKFGMVYIFVGHPLLQGETQEDLKAPLTSEG